MPQEKPLSILQAAKLIPVSHTAVQKAIASGRLVKCVVKDEKGKAKILGSLIRQEWADNTDAVRMESQGGHDLAGRMEREKKKAKQAPTPKAGTFKAELAKAKVYAEDNPEEDEEEELLKSEKSKLNESRAKREHYAAETQRIEYEKLVGNLVDAQKVRDDAFKVGRMVREALFNIPEQLAARLAAEKDHMVIHTMLTDELTRVMGELDGAIGKL